MLLELHSPTAEPTIVDLSTMNHTEGSCFDLVCTFAAIQFDTIRLTGDQQMDNNDYVCEARRGSHELNRS